LAAAVLLLSGVQLVMLGLIGEYLGRLYLTANRKPQSIVCHVERSAAALRPPSPIETSLVETRKL
jgi:undecaprenyl-phosphate 4-deoxy-4-formamido-L-arabinose transferase